MAETARLFQDHGEAELVTSSLNPHENTRMGRGARNFDGAIWDCVRRDAVLADTFAKFTLNPAMELYQLSTVAPNVKLPKPALLAPCGAPVSRRTTPRFTRVGGEEKYLNRSRSVCFDTVLTRESRPGV